jgi:protein-tyrosine phosphatase
LDDGAKSLDHAVAMARLAWNDGIRKIVATPHMFRENIDQGDFLGIRRKREELNQALDKKRIPLELLAGTEVHISHDLIHEIKKNRQELVINHSAYLFVEFPQDHVFAGVNELFFNLMNEGIKPIITHPERNTVFAQRPRLIYELIRRGVLVQSNSGSFIGLYGRKVEETAYRFLENRWIHFIASDGHGIHSIPPILSKAVRLISPIIGERNALHLVQDNPGAVISNQEVPYLPDPVNPSFKKKSFSLKKNKRLKKSEKKEMGE